MAPEAISSRHSSSAKAVREEAFPSTGKLTNTRKVQPGLKRRLETFLKNASSVPKISSPTDDKCRKRKLEEYNTKPLAPTYTSSKKQTASISSGTLFTLRRGPSKLNPSARSKPDASPTHKTTSSTSLLPLLRDEPSSLPKLKREARKANNTRGDICNEPAEKRLKTFRKQAPQTHIERRHRALTQRMIVIDRNRTDTEAYPKEDVAIVGSTGNIYTVTIGKLPSCTCPDNQKGNECKHIIYALHTILKAPEHLQYQRAFLSSELREIFANAPVPPTKKKTSSDTDGNRKPVDGECPICYMDLDEEEDELVWCKAACGNNMHKSCFEKWATSQAGRTVRCVYCRTAWSVDTVDLKDLVKLGIVGEDGYVNVAEQLGMRRARDTSSYNQFWMRRSSGYGQ